MSAQALEARWPQSRRRGRPGTPAEIVLRMLVLTHLFDWSYDDLEREVRANLVYRAFTRIDADEVPDANTIQRRAYRTDIASEISQLLNNRTFMDSLAAFLPPDSASQARRPLLERRLRTLGEMTR